MSDDKKSSYIIYKLNNNYPDFTQDLRELISGARDLEKHAYKYDYSETVPGNGLRSFVKIIDKFVDKIFKTLEKKNDVNADIIITAHVFNLILKLMKLIEIKRCSLAIDADDILNNLDEVIDDQITASILNIPPKFVASIFGLNFFWLSKSLKYHQKLYARLIGVYETSNPINIIKLINDKSVNDKYSKFSANCSAFQVRKSWGFYGNKLNKPFMTAINKFSPKIRKHLFIRRQNEWEIKSNGYDIEHHDADAKINGVQTREKIKCVFLQDANFGVSPKDSLVIHLHGGGYIALRPKCHEMYLRRWASKLNGVPILSIDYSLAPKHRFPVAIQEILDVYLFLTSGGDAVIDTIGFKPKNIVLFGDSAGSALSISLMNVLASINLQIENNYSSDAKDMSKHIPYPNALFLPYPHTNPTLNIFSPSRLFMAFDPVLPIGPMFALTEAYNPIKGGVASNATGATTDYDRKRSVLSTDTGYGSNISRSVSVESASSSASDISCDGDGPITKFDKFNITSSTDASYKDANNCGKRQSIDSVHDKKNDPWYRSEVRNERLNEMKENFLNLGPFFNPLKGNFSHFKHIPLYIQVGEFDVLLDDAISLSKKWAGKVKLDILNGMTHGFLFNRILSRECKKATNLCNERLLEALNLN